MTRNMMIKIMWMVFGILFLFSAPAFSEFNELFDFLSVDGWQLNNIQNNIYTGETRETNLTIRYSSEGNPEKIEMDWDNDGNAEEKLLLTQDSNGNITEMETDPYFEGISTPVKYMFYYDSSGNLNRVETDFSIDDSVDRYMEYRYTNGNLAELHDYSGDRHDTEIYTYDPGLNILTMKQKDKFSDKSIDVVTRYAYFEGKVSSESIDRDNDGTVDEIITYTYDETSGNLIKKETSGIIDKSSYNIENYTWTEVVAP